MHQFSKIALVAQCYFIFSAICLASTATPYLVNYVQPDGSTLSIRLKGDEHLKWAVTPDGYTILLNSSGFYEYASISQSGTLILSGVRAHDISGRTSEENKLLRSIPKELMFSPIQISAARSRRLRTMKTEGTTSFPTTGNRKLLLILIGFTDKLFTKTQTDFSNLMNQAGYTAGGATGSVKDYYLDNSFSQLSLTITVAGPYTASNTMAYYGANDASGNDLRPQALIQEAVTLANADVNYADYDNDNNGTVDGIYVVYAGYGEEAGASANTIWAHAWNLSSTLTLDGKSIYDYSTSSELYGTSGSVLTGIGVICHEFGHVLGLPDFYDTDYSGSGGQSFDPGNWDIMAGGSWNNEAKTPPFHNSYSRNLLGWQTSIVISSSTSVTLLNTAENNVSYRFNTTTANEYFVLENRQQLKWDVYIPGHGLIIYHVDKNYSGWSSNCGNCVPTHQGFDIEEADNIKTDVTSSGDSYPGTSNITSFTDATTPNAKSWAGANSNSPITNIVENTSTKVITFSFMDVSLTSPTLSTTVVSSITTISAASGGSISFDGGSSITARGVCWNTTGTPTITDGKTSDGTGTGTFISSITGLTEGTTYYVRAYATNSVGTSYGNQSMFTTSSSSISGNNIVLLDNFNRIDNTSIGSTPTAGTSLTWEKGSETQAGKISIASNALQLMSSSTAGREWTYVDIGSVSGYPATLSSSGSIVTWAFNMKQSRSDPSGFANGNYGVAFVLAASGTDITSANGYAVGLGNSGSTDNLKLFSFTGGLATSSAIVTGSADLGAEYLSVRVTFVPSTSTWSLFAESNASSFPQSNPNNTVTSAGTSSVNSTYTGTSLRYLGCLWNHSTSITDKALFDDIWVTDPGSVLPVELTEFSGTVKNSSVILRWSTATEINSHGFELERNESGSNWTSIGFIQGAGTSNIPLSYSFTDQSVSNGICRYRLKQIDNNGGYQYSKSIEVNLLSPTQFVLEQNYPNPFNPTTIIKYHLPFKTNVKITILDLLGRDLLTLVNEEQDSGFRSVQFNGAGFASGVYLYRMNAGKFTAAKKFLLIR